MKKKRIARGHTALLIPAVPNEKAFRNAFHAYYGLEANTWRWGIVNADSMYRIIKDACEQIIADDLLDIRAMLSYMALLA